MNTHNHCIKKELEEAVSILQAFLADEGNIQNISEAISMLSSSLQDGGKILSVGNGGSMSDAMHFAEELSGKFREERKALAAMACSDPSFISCAANDYGYDQVFSRFVEAFGQAGDAVLAISTSGNSENVIQACIKAKELGLKVIALTGKDGGKLSNLADVEIRAPKSIYADRAQEIHIKVIHCLIAGIEKELF